MDTVPKNRYILTSLAETIYFIGLAQPVCCGPIVYQTGKSRRLRLAI